MSSSAHQLVLLIESCEIYVHVYIQNDVTVTAPFWASPPRGDQRNIKLLNTMSDFRNLWNDPFIVDRTMQHNAKCHIGFVRKLKTLLKSAMLLSLSSQWSLSIAYGKYLIVIVFQVLNSYFIVYYFYLIRRQTWIKNTCVNFWLWRFEFQAGTRMHADAL